MCEAAPASGLLRTVPYSPNGPARSLKSDIDVSDPDAALAAMTLDRDVPPVRRFRGGEVSRRARRRDRRRRCRSSGTGLRPSA
jgi:hypothetical protein